MSQLLTSARRKAIYRLAALVFSVLVAYGVIDEGTAEAVRDAIPEFLAAVVSLLANANVTPDEDG